MAEALLSIPLEKLAIGEQMGLFASASDDVSEINGKLQLIKAVLVDAERKQMIHESVRVWLSKLKGIALDIEDVVDARQIARDEGKRCKVVVQVKKIRERLDKIYGDTVMSSFISHRPQTSSIVEESEIIDRDEDKEKVISWLVSDAEDGQQQREEEVDRKDVLQSYYNLPPHLKQCVAYCSIYQKDEAMMKNELVNLWVAQGFILAEGNRDTEDIGEEYFNGLVARSMFQGVHKDEEGNIICKMHDFLHDLATVINQDESYIFIASKKSNPQCSSISGVRHASLFLNEGKATISIASCTAKKLRTLFVNGSNVHRVTYENLFHQTRFLRALVFRRCVRMKVLPRAIGKLKHLQYLDLSRSSIAELPPKTTRKLKFLRYLDLSRTEIQELPESVSHLVNLHTVNLNGCRRLRNLRGGICQIVGLRHVYIADTDHLYFLPKGIGKLISLQSLSKFIVGRNEGECGIDELQELNALQGGLEITGLDRVSDAEQATRAQLCKKQYIRTLVLDISSYVQDDKDRERLKVLECLRPHPNLQDLFLKAFSISKLTLPSWIEDPSFSNLTRLVIFGFEEWERNRSMPGLGKLPALKCLDIRRVGVRKLSDEFYYGIGMISTSNDDGVGKRRGVAFPKLEVLILRYMWELEEWELTVQVDASELMPSLRQLEVTCCPKLQLLPSHLAIAPLSSSLSSSKVLKESKNRDELKPWPPASEHVLKPLERLQIFSCDELQSQPRWLGQLKKLQSLQIENATALTCLPDSLGQSLEKLEIKNCRRLESLPRSLGELKKLKSLTLVWLRELRSLPPTLGQLRKLQSLEIIGSRRLTYLPNSLEQLESLEDLVIEDCHRLECLPPFLGGLEKLKTLRLKSTFGLAYLPHTLGELASLEVFQIYDCPELTSLPNSLQRLSLLRELRISECPRLPYKWYGDRKSWPAISHIEKIVIDGISK